MKHAHLLPLATLLSTTLAVAARADGELPPPPPPPTTTTTTASPEVAPLPPEGVTNPGTNIADGSALAADGHPLAGWHNGLFFLRDYNDNFRLHVQGRAQIDVYSFMGPGVTDTTLKPTIFLRRVRPEITGVFFKDWSFMIAGDFGSTNVDNAKGTNETAAANPGANPTAGSAKFAGAQTVRISAAPTDVFVNYRAAKGLFNLQIGQFDAPFTLENRTSDKYFPFMERSLAVRVVGIPTNKEVGAMFWGETADKLFFYSAGLFNGDGQNRMSTDSRGDVMARVFVHPLATSMKDELKDLQIGGSIRWGSRDQHQTNYDYTGMTTQAGYTFWNPTYAGTGGTTHVIPSGAQQGFAGELRVPVSIVDLTSEFVYIKNDTREALDGYQATNTERFGVMKGYSYYVQLGLWAMGKRDVNGLPGYQNPPNLDFSKADPVKPPQALQLLVKFEQLKLNYASADRGGVADAKNIDGDIKVNVLSFGANYWMTKHLRFSMNYVYSMFPDSEPVKPTTAGGPAQTSGQRALAPGNTLAVGVNDDARDKAHALHELLFRVAVAL